MTLALILLLGHLVALYGDDTVFNCVDTDEGCPSKMCFYSIDHEKVSPKLYKLLVFTVFSQKKIILETVNMIAG
nr:unnamed protein product [Haemonchus contortus]